MFLGLRKTLAKSDTVARADSPWSLYGWVYLTEAPKGPTLIAGVGDPLAEYSQLLAHDGNKLLLWTGKDSCLAGGASLTPGSWHFVMATFDGHEFHPFSGGNRIAAGKLELCTVHGFLQLAPPAASHSG